MKGNINSFTWLCLFQFVFAYMRIVNCLFGNYQRYKQLMSNTNGYHPTLDDSNAFRVLAAASFLDLQVSLHVNYSVSTGPSVGSISFGECITELYIMFFLNWLPTGFCSMFDLNVTFLAGFMCNLHRFHYI